jgi:hypothetical protein
MISIGVVKSFDFVNLWFWVFEKSGKKWWAFMKQPTKKLSFRD